MDVDGDGPFDLICMLMLQIECDFFYVALLPAFMLLVLIFLWALQTDYL